MCFSFLTDCVTAPFLLYVSRSFHLRVEISTFQCFMSGNCFISQRSLIYSGSVYNVKQQTRSVCDLCSDQIMYIISSLLFLMSLWINQNDLPHAQLLVMLITASD